MTCWQQLLAGTAAASLQVVGFAENILESLCLEEPVDEMSGVTFQVVKLAGKCQKVSQIGGFAAVGIKMVILQTVDAAVGVKLEFL